MAYDVGSILTVTSPVFLLRLMGKESPQSVLNFLNLMLTGNVASEAAALGLSITSTTSFPAARA